MAYLDKYKLILNPGLTMANFWDLAVGAFGDREVSLLEEPLEYSFMPKDTLTYRDNLELVNRMGNALRDLGVGEGDRVVIAMGNRIELLLLSYACFKVGAIAVPLNYMLKDNEIRYIAQNCGARVLATDRDVFDSNIRRKEAVPGIETWIMAGPPSEVLEGFVGLTDAMEAASSGLEPVRLDKNATCAIFYTSGTTGYPKGAMMTSKNLLTTQRITAALVPLRNKDLGISGLPNAHLMGFAISLLLFMFGARGYFVKYFHPKRVLEALQEKKAAVFVGVPAMYSMMLAFGADNYDLSSVKLWVSGADAIPVEHIQKFVGYGGFFFEGYGQVETSPITALKLTGRRFGFEQGCVGLPVPPVRVQIWDEEGRKVPKGEAGELVVRGPNVLKGYWNDSSMNEEAFRGGWFHTGDMARRGAFRVLYFVDRKKDVVKAGGYSVFSKEVEEELRACPGVDEAAVVGVPHPTKVEVVCAVVTPLPGQEISSEELMAWARSHIADYKAPRYIEVRDEMPYGMTLKVLKRTLRDELTAKVDVTKL